METELHLVDEVAEILIVDAADVADPLVRLVGFGLLAEGEGQGAIDVGEDHLALDINH